MTDLKAKIRNTHLFTQQEKIDILAALDTFPASDFTQLEAIIDEYDAKLQGIKQTFLTNMTQELNTIVQKAGVGKKAQLERAAKQIRQGLDTVVAAS